MLLKRLLPAAIALTLLMGCGQAEVQSTAKVRELSGSSKTVNLGNSARVKELLYAQHKVWMGVRYKENGLSKKGVDCSGFVHLTFLYRLGRKIPRTTEALARTGTRVNRSELRPGDLVFFKTGTKLRHVGIYVEKGKFLHASTSKGVIISRLRNVYWDENFWQARRL
jgi:cell wall-associated NlpC family hydrolase